MIHNEWDVSDAAAWQPNWENFFLQKIFSVFLWKAFTHGKASHGGAGGKSTVCPIIYKDKAFLMAALGEISYYTPEHLVWDFVRSGTCLWPKAQQLNVKSVMGEKETFCWSLYSFLIVSFRFVGHSWMNYTTSSGYGTNCWKMMVAHNWLINYLYLHREYVMWRQEEEEGGWNK